MNGRRSLAGVEVVWLSLEILSLDVRRGKTYIITTVVIT